MQAKPGKADKLEAALLKVRESVESDAEPDGIAFRVCRSGDEFLLFEEWVSTGIAESGGRTEHLHASSDTRMLMRWECEWPSSQFNELRAYDVRCPPSHAATPAFANLGVVAAECRQGVSYNFLKLYSVSVS